MKKCKNCKNSKISECADCGKEFYLIPKKLGMKDSFNLLLELIKKYENRV